MAKQRTKKRTHIKTNGASNGPGRPNAGSRTPKSMVIRMGAGQVGPSISQLAKDVRAMMEPDTASRLKVRSMLR
jgi:ribosome biogenesis protein SSF1/2